MKKNTFFFSWAIVTVFGCSLLLSSCKVKEYPYRNYSNAPHYKRTPYYFANKYDGILSDRFYQKATQFINGLAAVKLNDRWGFIDAEENVVVPIEYAWLSALGNWGFDEDLAVAKTEYDGWTMPIMALGSTFLINKKGERVSSVYKAFGPIRRKYAMVNNGTNFKQVGRAFLKSDGKWGFINKKGKEVIKCKYDLAYSFNDIITFVQSNGKWGCINELGKEIIPCQYDEVYYKSDVIEVNSPVDLADPEEEIKVDIIKEKNVIYMVSDGIVYRFNTKGKLLSKEPK